MSSSPECRPKVLNQKATASKEFKPPRDWQKRPEFVNCDRRTIFGNPYEIGKDGDRTQVLLLYAEYLRNRLTLDEKFREAVAGLAGKTLVCWCKPLDCHCDLLADACVKVNEWIAREAKVPEPPPKPEPVNTLYQDYLAECSRRAETMKWAARKINSPSDVRKWIARYARPTLRYTYEDYLRDLTFVPRELPQEEENLGEQEVSDQSAVTGSGGEIEQSPRSPQERDQRTGSRQSEPKSRRKQREDSDDHSE